MLQSQDIERIFPGLSGEAMCHQESQVFGNDSWQVCALLHSTDLASPDPGESAERVSDLLQYYHSARPTPFQ